VVSGQQFCSYCGTALAQPSSTTGATSFEPPAAGWVGQPVGTGSGPANDADFPSGAKLLAGVLTFFAPFISLIAALALRSSERGQLRRATLRTWAIASGVWLGAGVLIGIIAIASISSSATQDKPNPSGPCVGGPEMGSSGVDLGHNRFRFPCDGGGTTVVKF
jgi:hypothetical protein